MGKHASLGVIATAACNALCSEIARVSEVFCCHATVDKWYVDDVEFPLQWLQWGVTLTAASTCAVSLGLQCGFMRL